MHFEINKINYRLIFKFFYSSKKSISNSKCNDLYVDESFWFARYLSIRHHCSHGLKALIDWKKLIYWFLKTISFLGFSIERSLWPQEKFFREYKKNFFLIFKIQFELEFSHCFWLQKEEKKIFFWNYYYSNVFEHNFFFNF